MWLLCACPAERLGIELPPGGAEAISHEDLQRDVYLLTRGEPRVAFAKRMGQMRFSPDGECFVREGGGPPRVLVARSPDEAAALISLAKGWDLAGGVARTTRLCFETEEIPTGERVEIGALPHGDYVAMQQAVAALYRRVEAQ